MLVRTRIIISGKVQGVFFRAYTQETAIQLNLRGWVKNNPEGTVEALFEGDQKQVEKMLEWCKLGPSSAIVEQINTLEEIKPIQNYSFSSFLITY